MFTWFNFEPSDDDSDEEEKQYNKCSLVWEVRLSKLYYHFL